MVNTMPTRLYLFGIEMRDAAMERKKILFASLVMLAVLVIVEWVVRFDVSLGILYVFPVVVAAVVLNRWQILILSVLCALIRGQFTPRLSFLEGILRFAMASVAYAAAGLLVAEINRNRQRILEHYARLKLERDLRQNAEEQLRILAESSPAAILTLNSEAEVAAANRAAHEMFGFAPGEMVGVSIAPYFPVFQNALAFSPGGRPMRTSISGWAHRNQGPAFPVQAWFSTYGTGGDHALAAILVDMSEEVRDRERDNFRHLVDYNRLLAGAVSHEIRNMCSAISVVCTNLARTPGLAGNADFDALQRLTGGLNQIASFKLKPDHESMAAISLRTVLDQLIVVIEPDWNELGGNIDLRVDETLPAVAADPHVLMQIFLNLSQNSCRAVASTPVKTLTIRASEEGDRMVVHFEDTGTGIKDPASLFQPFKPDSDGSGLGLYVSRTLARSLGGDLVFVPTAGGCRFDLQLQTGIT